VEAVVAGLFRDADANHDGLVTHQEFATLARSDRLFEVAGFDYFDANGDGQLSLSEIADKPKPRVPTARQERGLRHQRR